MAVSKVVLGNETLVDLTSDTVSEDTLLEGATAHAANGEQITGGVVVTPMYTGTKSAIESAIASGEIPDGAVVNITDDEETSSFQTQINEINSSLEWYIRNGYLPDPNNPTLNIYNKGNECTEVTNGWSATVTDDNTSFSKNTDNMSLIRNSNSGNIIVFTNKPINVTNFESITLKYKSGDNVYISLSSNRTSSTSSAENSIKLLPASDYIETTIDISSITGNKYVGFYCNEENTSINIMEVILNY